MRDRLAEELLAKVMGWTPEQIAQERPMLQAMAAHKYDEYQQYSPGMRFVESLSLWLLQFRTAEDKNEAYSFAMNRLVFCSSAEMIHLVSMAYPDLIRPRMLRRVAQEGNFNRWHYPKIANSTSFKLRERQTLFLGLSDGSRIDTFRRLNPGLSNEQVWQTYELSKSRVETLLGKLRGDVKELAWVYKLFSIMVKTAGFWRYFV